MNTPMTNSRSHTILVAYSNSNAAGEVQDILSLSSRFQAVMVEMGDLTTTEVAGPLDLIVVDLQVINDRELEILADMRVRFGGIPLIIVSEALSGAQMRRLFKLHVHDWLPKPLDKKQFYASLQSAIQNVKTTQSQVHAIVSASGGAGATSISISMAQMLARSKGKVRPTVALFDLDFSTGNCGYILNQPGSFGIDSVIESPSRVDAEFVNIIRQTHPAHFDIFSFKRPELVFQPKGEELILRMLDAVSMMHDHTILDIPYYETAWKEEVLTAVNSITIVTEMNLPSLKHAKELVERVRDLRDDKFSLNVLVNKYESSWIGGSLSHKAIKDLFGDVDVTTIAADTSTLRESFDRGVLPYEVNGRSKFLRDLTKFVKKSDLVMAK